MTDFHANFTNLTKSKFEINPNEVNHIIIIINFLVKFFTTKIKASSNT